MAQLLIENAKIILPSSVLERGWLLIEDSKIKAFGIYNAPTFEADKVIDAEGKIMLPGFIDIHCHGAVGHDFMSATPEEISKIAEFYAKHGVTSFLATTHTQSHDKIYQAMQTINTAQTPNNTGARLLGVHMEGPYLNRDKAGAQYPEHVRLANRDEMQDLFDLDIIRLISLAPEFEENHWLIRECVRRGIAVSVAHSSATYAQMQVAIELGITHATHTFNAMTGLHHRNPGIVGASMDSDSIRAELIADNIHVHPVAMRVLWKAKGRDGIVLITDSQSFAGLDDGQYQLDDRVVIVEDGKCSLSDGTLAGSVITLNKAFSIFCDVTGLSIDQAWHTSSLNAAHAIGLSNSKGSIEVGKDADIILIDDDFSVHLTIVEGKIVYGTENNIGESS